MNLHEKHKYHLYAVRTFPEGDFYVFHCDCGARWQVSRPVLHDLLTKTKETVKPKTPNLIELLKGVSLGTIDPDFAARELAEAVWERLRKLGVDETRRGRP